jgi:hypothetical protein
MDRDKAEISESNTAAEPAPRYRRRGRPRKADIDLNVIDGGFAGSHRPDPPDTMTKRQKQIWRDIVASEPVDFFQSHTTREMLGWLVGHIDAVERVQRSIDDFKPEWLKNGEGAKRFKLYLKMRGEETGRGSLIATRLRLTNQSRYTPQAAATAGRNQAKVRPWEEE